MMMLIWLRLSAGGQPLCVGRLQHNRLYFPLPPTPPPHPEHIHSWGDEGAQQAQRWPPYLKSTYSQKPYIIYNTDGLMVHLVLGHLSVSSNSHYVIFSHHLLAVSSARGRD